MAELKAKKFGYVVHPPPPPNFHPPYPPPPPPPPGISMTDWIAYINSYIDVRARQLYDKLKGLYNAKIEETDDLVHDHICFRDPYSSTGVRKMYINNDTLFTEEYAPPSRDVDEILTEIPKSTDESKG